MRQTKDRITVFENDTTKVVVEVRQEIETPILDALHRDWWEKNCREDQEEREMYFIFGSDQYGKL